MRNAKRRQRAKTPGTTQLCCGFGERRAMTELRHYDHEGTARFVTFECYRNLRGIVSEPGEWR